MTPARFERRVAAALPAGRAGRILAAVSGGADSVAMVRALQRLQSGRDFQLYAAHLNHRLRGDASDGDAIWVERLCRELNVTLRVEKTDVLTAGPGGAIEETARRLRYGFLTETARTFDCPWVAAAHTADDQAETILHHILRGTGLAGLRGMPAERVLADAQPSTLDESAIRNPQSTIQLIRPLLELRRSDVEAYLEALGQTHRQDATNTDRQFTRNRIRHVLLPLLREQFNPRVEDALLRLSQQARESAGALDSVAVDLLSAAALEITPEICRLDRKPLRNAHPHLVRCALVLLWDRAGWPRQTMGFDDWQRAAALIHKDGALTLPGNIDARTRGNALVLRRGVTSPN
ncbi:MAG: tRNA lysidine(34) synthetase TilS [Planctomycetaceae bacterium]